MKHTIGFPGLGLEFEVNRVAFTLFGRDIYWYGLIIVLGLVLGTVVALRNAKKIGMSADTIYDFLLWAIPLSVIGARIYYVATKWSEYREHPISVLYLWEGGIAVYGSIIAAILTLLVFCKIKKIPAYDLLDCCCVGLILGQAVGRWGNFVNAEAYGTSTTLPWRMSLLEGGRMIEVHPTFLYESLWDFGVFVLLMVLFTRKRTFPGKVFWNYLLWYGIGRFFIEGLRTDSLYIGSLRISQCVAALSVIVSVIMLFWLSKQMKRNKEENPCST